MDVPQVIPAAVAAASSLSLTYAALPALAQVGIQLAASAALTAASIAMQDTPRTPDIKRSLGMPRSLPPYRFVYGRYETYGSPAPFRVRGGKLYACMLLNSRPSAGGQVKIRFDKRDVTLSGDLYNFAGPGAAATNPRWQQSGPLGGMESMVHAWLGLGDQTGPPAEIVAESPDLFQSTDAWRGRTVLWLRLRSGGNTKKVKRWPRVPPEIEVEMNYSKLWDPRIGSQSPTNPATWTFSDNQMLVLLDALMRNPIGQYKPTMLHLQSLMDAADVCDEPVTLKDGGTEPRYRAAGPIDWSAGEFEQLIEPIILAGGGGVSRVGGKLYFIPGKWFAPEITIKDAALDGELSVEAMQPGDSIFTGVKTTYIDPGRDWREADAGVYDVPGAHVADGGVEKIRTVDLPMVTSPTQAQRLGKYLALYGRKQKQITATFPPETFEAVAGSVVDLDLVAPYNRLSGTFEVASLDPGFDVVGKKGGVAMRCPGSLRITGPEIWDWNPAVDERDVFEVVEFDGDRLSLAMPGVITAVSGAAAALGSGATAQARIRFDFDPADDEDVDFYDVEYRLSGGSWQDGGKINASIRDSDGDVFDFIHPVDIGQSYDIRVRSRNGNDESDWRYYNGIVATAASVTLAVPTRGNADPSTTGRINVSFRIGNSESARGIQFWHSTTATSGSATVLGPTMWGGANQTIEIEHTGLVSGSMHYYWAKTVGPNGSVSGFSAMTSETAP